jgi:hypothetical protein
MMRSPLAFVLVGLAFAATATGSGTTASPFELTMTGRVGKQVGLAKWLHEGTFTAAAPFCSAGRGEDISAKETRPTISDRVFTCGDGRGSITARVVSHEAEHTVEVTGTWAIVSGTGAFADLRGHGTLTGAPLSGDPRQPGTLTFRTTWRGVVDFDAVGPSLEITRLSALKLRRPAGSYSVRIGFSTADNVAPNAVSYEVRALRSNFQLASKRGETAGGEVSVMLRVRSLEPLRKLRLEIDALDPLGNKTSIARALKLPR